METNYWTGPYGVRVPMNVFSVVDIDGRNTVNQAGMHTQMHIPRDRWPSREAYLAKHCRRVGDIWWYSIENK